MKLAIAILKYFPHGGLQRDFLRIAEEAAKRGHTVTAYTTGWTGDLPSWLNVEILDPPAFSNHRKAEKFFRMLHERLQENPCDLLLGMCRGSGLDVYFAGDECFAANQAKKHSRLFCRFSERIRVFSAMEAAIFSPESRTQILCLTERQKEEYIKHYGTQPERMRLIPPGMNPDCIYPENAEKLRMQFRKERGISDDEIVLLCVGANLKLKGADRVMSAVKALPESLRNRVTVFLIGKKTKELERMAASIPAKICFEGMIDHILPWYLASDLMVHPARSEAAGSVLIEAIATGLPVICTELCGFSTYVRASNAGHVLPGTFHQEELNAVLESLLMHRENLKFLSREALEYASHINLTGRSKAIVDFLEKIQHGIH